MLCKTRAQHVQLLDDSDSDEFAGHILTRALNKPSKTTSLLEIQCVIQHFTLKAG